MVKVDKDLKHIYTDGDEPTVFEQLQVRQALAEECVDVPDVDEEWSRMKASLDASVPVETETAALSSSHGGRAKAVRLFTIIAAAAAVALLLVMVLRQNAGNDLEIITAKNNTKDITITTDNGDSKVVSGNKPIAFNTKSETVGKTADLETMHVTTPRGKTCMVTLPDGSRVWLNSESSVTFLSRFIGNERNIALKGEAFLEVKKDPRKPFMVFTEWFTTTVHGTSFNVRAYSATDASVALVSGSVTVTANDGTESLLKPGQQAVVTEKGVNVSPADTYALTQWKDGFFYFDNARLADIMMAIGRWYNVSVVFESEGDMDGRYHFVAGHNEKLTDIIKRINDLGTVHCQLDGDVISVR